MARFPVNAGLRLASWALAALLLLKLAAAPPIPAEAEASLTLSSASALPGATVSATGAGFTPNSTVLGCWVGPGHTCQVPLFQGPTDASGRFTFTFLVPTDAPGT